MLMGCAAFFSSVGRMSDHVQPGCSKCRLLHGSGAGNSVKMHFFSVKVLMCGVLLWNWTYERSRGVGVLEM